MKRGLLIYSGGMDSTCLLYWWKHRIEMCITFQYGSKHSAREVEMARKNCIALGIKHEVINIEQIILPYFKSDLLTSGEAIPEGHYEHESMKRTVVPFRNGIMLSLAAGIAESNGLHDLLIANHAGDHAIYPDCRPDFIDMMGKAILRGTYKNIILMTPFLHFTKRQVALIGQDEKVNFNDTWSCYKGETRHCGRCGTCVERQEALQGFDPTTYKAEPLF